VNATVYIAGILLQAIAGIIALQQVRLAPRKLPWLLIALSSLLIVGRRSATLGQFMKAGRELAAAEVLTLVVSLLFLLGVLLMSRMFRESEAEHRALQDAMEQIKTLRGILPVCAQCKRIRDERGRWHQMEAYVRDNTHAEFSHGLCVECSRQFMVE
jgi:hypothetical protein